MNRRAPDMPPWSAQLEPLLNAQPVPPRQRQHWPGQPVPVVARTVWERSGEEHLEGVAVAWTPALVLVHFEREPRLQTHGAWLVPTDVSRR